MEENNGRYRRRYKTVLLVDKITGLVIRRFESEYDAAAFAGVKVHAMRDTLKNLRVSSGRFIYRYPEDYCQNELLNYQYNMPVIVMGKNGKCRAFTKAQNAARTIGIDNNTLYKHISSGIPICGYKIAYCRHIGDAELMQTACMDGR